MKKFLTKLAVGLAALSLVNVDAEACTIMLVIKGASAAGNVFVSHCDDGFGNDPNTVFVPAKNHKKGSFRPVYSSADTTKAIGHIPEVEHTYAYIDADYPAMNEHGLMLAECTDLCDWLPEIPYKEGGGIFYSSELGRVVMERCKTAREAIKLMGELVDEYGIYGKSKSMFDITTKNTAGLHGSPYDYTESSERAILSADTSYVYIAQVNDKLPAPVLWLSTNTALENPFVPFTVAKMPAAYNFALRDKYDDSKMFWASSQVIALSRGYWNSLGGTVEEAVRHSEKNSLELVDSSLNLSKEKFAAALNKNAVKVFDDWKNLYTKLLLQYDGGTCVKYDERHLSASNAPTKY